MLEKIGKGILVIILTVGVLLGAFLGYSRYFIELQDRTVELCVDLNDLKKIAAYEKKPLSDVLDAVNKMGIKSIGVFEETLPDALSQGEVYYSKGTGVLRLGLLKEDNIKPASTYIFASSAEARERIFNQLLWVAGPNNIKFLNNNLIEVDEIEENLRGLGLGISEIQKKYLTEKGFSIIPRVWNDPRYHLGNIDQKISALDDFDTVIFDGEEILGYPQEIGSLAAALKKYKINYGYIEIVKQEGDQLLRKLMARDVLRVHSVPEDELKKITKDEAVDRFVRAARERKVRLIYLRPFLPPQVEAYPVAYNLDYFSKVKSSLGKAGFVLGKAERIYPLEVKGWQILVLGAGVIIGALFLINYFVKLPVFLIYLFIFLSAGGLALAGSAGYGVEAQKGLALLAGITFPTLAVISTLSQTRKSSLLLWDSVLMVLNIVGETMVGVFLLIGLLADYRFMLGVETFSGVKIALFLPIMLVALFFILKQGEGSLKNRLLLFLKAEVPVGIVLTGLIILGALAVFIARSGNFVLPVPAVEKQFRSILETMLFIRPRTKEFLVGYPFLFMASIYLLRGKQKWIWILASIGAIAPISVFNSFSHIHTPIIVSIIRTINGLGLGILVGLIVALMADRFIERE